MPLQNEPVTISPVALTDCVGASVPVGGPSRDDGPRAARRSAAQGRARIPLESETVSMTLPNSPQEQSLATLRAAQRPIRYPDSRE